MRPANTLRKFCALRLLWGLWILLAGALRGATYDPVWVNSSTYAVSWPTNLWTVNAGSISNALGLAGMAIQAPASVSITGGTITGITDLSVADGGTGASTAAGARTNLGLTIGSDVQSYDAELAAIAGLTSAADTLPYFSGSGAASTTTLTTYARSLLDDADAATARTTLGAASTAGTLAQFGATTSAELAGVVSDETGSGALVLSASPKLTGNVILGSASAASAPLHIGDTTGSNSSDAQVVVRRAVNDSSSGNGHCFSDSSIITRSGTIGYNSFDGRVVISGTNNFDHYVPFQAGPTYSSSGTITDVYGFFSGPTVTAGTVTSNYGLYVNNASVSGGSIVNDYGLFINGPVAGTTQNWSIYTTGNAMSRLGGPLGIGVNPTQTTPLYVYTDTNAVVSHTFRNGNSGSSAASWVNITTAAGTLEMRVYPTTGTFGDTALIRWNGLTGGLAFFNSGGTAEVCRMTDGGLLTFGGVASSNVGLKPSGTELTVRTGNDGADASLKASQLTTSGGRVVARASDTSTAITLNSGHHFVTLNNASAVTVNLPAAASNSGREYWLKNLGAGSVTVDPNASEQIRDTTTDASTLTLTSGLVLHFICDGTRWERF